MGAIGGVMQQLYNDLRPWLASCATFLPRIARNMTAPSLTSLEPLADALSKQVIRSGDLIKIECKPSLFGAFLRNRFLTPLIGPHTSLRLGPSIRDDNPYLGMVRQFTTHWTPVGLYPSIEPGNVSQVCLYPSDASCAGIISVLPSPKISIPHFFALFAERHVPYCGKPCRVTCVVRSIADSDFVHSGFTREDFEVVRQNSNMWVLDATGDESDCDLLSAGGKTPELWGGLYASGHLELASGTLRINPVVDALVGVLKEMKFDGITAVRNHAGRKEIAIFGQGIRATMDTQLPLYSIHMDAELDCHFEAAMHQFDHSCSAIFNALMQECVNQSVEIRNPRDFDFSYTNSAAAFTILHSLSADSIKDPVAVAIRDWHRRRCRSDAESQS